MRCIGSSVVGLFPFDNSGYVVGNTVYHSAGSGCIPFRRVEDGELVASTAFQFGGIPAHDHQLMDQVVEGGAQLVDRLASKQHQGNVWRSNINILDADESANRMTVIDIWLHSDGIRFQGREGSEFPIQGIDMGAGSI